MQATTRPDHVWPEVWTRIGKAAQNREQQERPKAKQKLDNARKLRGICFFLIWMTKNIQKFSKVQEESWKDLWFQPCHAKGWRGSIRASGNGMRSQRLTKEEEFKTM